MPQSLHRFLLERIAHVARPVFRSVEFTAFSEVELRLWIEAGILRKTSVPESVWKVCEDGVERLLTVHSGEDSFYGISDDPECLIPAIPLTAVDVTHYAYSPKAFARVIARSNGFDLTTAPPQQGLWQIAVHQGRPVFLLAPMWNPINFEIEAIRLAEQLNGAPCLLITPTPVGIPLNAVRTLGDAGIETAFLDSEGGNPFSLAWPDKGEAGIAVRNDQIEFDGVDWIFTYRGKRSSIRDSNNVRYIIYLIYHVRQQFSHLDLWTKLQPHEDPRQFEQHLKTGTFTKDNKLEISAAELEAMEKDLLSQLQEAEEANNDKLCDLLEKKIDQIREFRATSQPGETDARKSSPYELAKATINRARRETLGALRRNEFGGELAEHLKISITPGDPGFLVYSPNPSVNWTFKNMPETLRERSISPK